MHQLRFLYEQKIDFGDFVINHQFVYRCIPKSEPRQEVVDLQVEVSPCDYQSFGEDGFGNRTIYGRMTEEHRQFFVRISGIVKTDWQMYDRDDSRNHLFIVQTPLTDPGISMKAYLERISSCMQAKHRNYDKAYEIMDHIYDWFTYTKGVTGTDTTADQAFALKMGVCQDYAHVMIGMCRYFGIPARYVSGAMIGEGFSHAWVEIFSDGKWYGFDPTNHLLVDDFYIVFARGRDSSDCIINKGSYLGRSKETQKIKVFVEEIK
ncbi:MAG: transglutaminase family protein [Lachnospiraceae bacterium]|nr:transglutaminase family protein [Lachnospiraceae bacterium]